MFIFYRGDGNDSIADFNKTEGDIIVKVDKGVGGFGNISVRGDDASGSEYTVADILQGHSVIVDEPGKAYMLVGAGSDGSKKNVDGIEFDNVLVGGDQNDVIIGGNGNNLLVGGSGDDYIMGGNGNDVIYGGPGNNILIGGGGSDIFAWAAEDLDGGSNRILDFSFKEDDKLNFSDLMDQEEGFAGLLDLVSITSIDDSTLHMQVQKGGGCMDLEINFQNNELQDFINDYVERNGTTDNLNEALLAQLIQNVTG